MSEELVAWLLLFCIGGAVLLPMFPVICSAQDAWKKQCWGERGGLVGHGTH